MTPEVKVAMESSAGFNEMGIDTPNTCIIAL